MVFKLYPLFNKTTFSWDFDKHAKSKLAVDSQQQIRKLNRKQNVHKTNILTKTKQHVPNNQLITN